MRITKKIPIKPRGRTEQKKHIARDAIREAYTQPQKDVTVIPAKRDMIPESEKKKLRVCAYCRVSTEALLRGRLFLRFGDGKIEITVI